MVYDYVGMVTVGVARGANPRRTHIGAFMVSRDNETGDIIERDLRFWCRRPLPAAMTIVVQAGGVLVPTCRMCRSNIQSGSGSIDLDRQNQPIRERFPDDLQFQLYLNDPDMYFATKPEKCTHSDALRAHQSDVVNRRDMGEVSSYIVDRQEYQRVRSILDRIDDEMPGPQLRDYLVGDLMVMFPDDSAALLRLCTAALAVRAQPSGKKRLPVAVLYHHVAAEASM